jgi:hypothetical protein
MMVGGHSHEPERVIGIGIWTAVNYNTECSARARGEVIIYRWYSARRDKGFTNLVKVHRSD